MEGMLIFAGLFSASLTAFIVESYKTLVPDSGDSTVHLLTQISQQLRVAAAANGSAVTPLAPQTHFAPPATSLICNALWFISLGFSLTCALVATLLEQWARDFLHRADMRSSPVIRARIFSYLYYGLKRFNMHTVVDVIPLLLRASLCFFFVGLVAFLLPINIAIAGLAAAILAIVVGVYMLLTVLPMWHLDCPYRTPLSNACWRLSQYISTLWRRQYTFPGGRRAKAATAPGPTIVEAMAKQATEVSLARSARDKRALVWTVKSLADDNEFEHFVEAIPDVLWGPDHRRHALLHTSDLRLLERIQGLLISCDSGLLSQDDKTRRQATCFKAPWVISSLLSDPGSSINPQSTLMTPSSEHWVHHYSTSADALIRWSIFCRASHHLAQCEASIKAGRSPNLEPIYSCLLDLGHSHKQEEGNLKRLQESVGDVAQFAQAAQDFRTAVSYSILVSYLEHSGMFLDSLPYRWRNTIAIMKPRAGFIGEFSLYQEQLEEALSRVVKIYMNNLSSTKNMGWIDEIVHQLCSLWRPSEAVCIPSAIIRYFHSHKDDAVLKALLRETGLKTYLWLSLPITVSHGASERHEIHALVQHASLDEILQVIWRMASLAVYDGPSSASTFESVIQALAHAKSSISFSTTAMVKCNILHHLYQWTATEINELLPTETAFVASGSASEDSFFILRERVPEARICVFADFIANCSADRLYRAEDTLYKLGDTAPRRQIHRSHQIRLAEGMRGLLNHSRGLLEALMQCDIFHVYAGVPENYERRPRHAWLENPLARGQIKNTLSTFASGLPQGPVLTRVNTIIQGLDVLHEHDE
ncbi:hypothetical protein GGX14DRAFT_455845 [Mycena pura]|uniref:DUF6535 domain-containing protein n=1 Tax=Mycena pura TaxID=153505 RepID=A0AAD6VES4_9AGAR|nr:hypothetical protein GGX14DRAFT_455845 [Mycena pura]